MGLKEALCGSLINVPLLGGTKKTMNCTDEVIKPNTIKRIQGAGLPYPKDPNRKGDLIVKFDIAFPDRISQNSKDILGDILGGRWKILIAILVPTMEHIMQSKLLSKCYFQYEQLS